MDANARTGFSGGEKTGSEYCGVLGAYSRDMQNDSICNGHPEVLVPQQKRTRLECGWSGDAETEAKLSRALAERHPVERRCPSAAHGAGSRRKTDCQRSRSGVEDDGNSKAVGPD